MARLPVVEVDVKVPEDVKISIEGKKVRVEGPKGVLERAFDYAPVIIEYDENSRVVKVFSYFPRRREKAMVGTIAAHIRNMIIGVTKGFVYRLKIVYSHYPINVRVEGNKVYIENFLGERAPRVAEIVGNVKVRVEQDDVVVEGINIEEVGQTAANIQQATKIKDKDPRIFQDGIYLYERQLGDVVKRII
ncbi:MAG: 50S ribosomal protein L6 [Candidatus Baldrarchaeia archaeon]